MDTVQSPRRHVERATKRVARSRALDRLARMLCRGVLYALIGVLGVQIAVGAGSGRPMKQVRSRRSPGSRSGLSCSP